MATAELRYQRHEIMSTLRQVIEGEKGATACVSSPRVRLGGRRGRRELDVAGIDDEGRRRQLR